MYEEELCPSHAHTYIHTRHTYESHSMNNDDSTALRKLGERRSTGASKHLQTCTGESQGHMCGVVGMLYCSCSSSVEASCDSSYNSNSWVVVKTQVEGDSFPMWGGTCNGPCTSQIEHGMARTNSHEHPCNIRSAKHTVYNYVQVMKGGIQKEQGETQEKVNRATNAGQLEGE